MEDERIWKYERDLWIGEGAVYRERVSDKGLMALPSEPYLFAGEQAQHAVENTPKWDEVAFSETKVSRPQEGLIVIAYRVEARTGDKSYHAVCTSTLRRLSHEEWDVVQHQQTPLGVLIADPAEG